MELPTSLIKPIVFDDCNKVYNSLYIPTNIAESLLTKYELTTVLGLRTTQLENGAQPFISIEDIKINTNIDLNKIATHELLQGKIPFIISRNIPNNKTKYIRLKDLDLTAVKYMLRI
jgi:DNA-directed RNA polymerase subunit K/omega